MVPLKPYRLPLHAVPFFGSRRSNEVWGGVPWSKSLRWPTRLAGLPEGGLQRFVTNPPAVFWESDCDIDYDGPSSKYTSTQLLKHDQYWQGETSLSWRSKWTDFEGRLTRYCDSRTFMGAVMPPQFRRDFGLNVGDYCLCCYEGRIEPGQIYDTGPRAKIGEVSFAMAAALGISNNPRTGNGVKDLCTLAFPGSGNGYAEDQEAQLEACLVAFGKLTGRI